MYAFGDHFTFETCSEWVIVRACHLSWCQWSPARHRDDIACPWVLTQRAGRAKRPHLDDRLLRVVRTMDSWPNHNSCFFNQQYFHCFQTMLQSLLQNNTKYYNHVLQIMVVLLMQVNTNANICKENDPRNAPNAPSCRPSLHQVQAPALMPGRCTWIILHSVQE